MQIQRGLKSGSSLTRFVLGAHPIIEHFVEMMRIREIISTQSGAGSEMLARLREVEGATSLFAKCPIDLEANDWYERRGFTCEGEEMTRTGRVLKLWRLRL